MKAVAAPTRAVATQGDYQRKAKKQFSSSALLPPAHRSPGL